MDFRSNLFSLYDQKDLITHSKHDYIAIEVNPLVASLPLKLVFPTGQSIKGNIVLDTGAPIPNSPVAKEYGLDKELGKTKDRVFKTQAAVQTATEVRAESIRIGEFGLTDIPVFVSTSKRGLFAVKRYSGIVGTGFLSRFNVILDCQRQRLSLVKLANH